jgi:DNA-directed RNA polymerase specialized sigma24 family protein
MLCWLDADRERAANRYEEIRRRLIKFFSCRQCAAAEDLTDETMNRVARKVQEGPPHLYVLDAASYFYGVAHNVYLEHVRRKPAAPPPPLPTPTEEVEREQACLELCLEKLAPRSRELISEFYREDGQAKIDHRKRLAGRLGLTPNALRIQAHRIRVVLLGCMRLCLAEHELL